jgi:hypothetical protein
MDYFDIMVEEDYKKTGRGLHVSDYILDKYANSNYIVVEFDELQINDLVEEVNYLICNGYSPIGGISVRTGGDCGAYLLQAMVKENK